MNNHLLLIEDEDIGGNFKLQIEKYLGNVKVTWVRNGKEAMMAIDTNISIKVVIFDQLLEQTNERGTDVMASIKKKRPDIIAILLSAVASRDELYRGIDKGVIYKYINKTNVEEMEKLPELVIQAFYEHTTRAIKSYNQPELIYSKFIKPFTLKK